MNDPNHLLYLQRTIGNRATQNLIMTYLKSGSVPNKPVVSPKRQHDYDETTQPVSDVQSSTMHASQPEVRQQVSHNSIAQRQAAESGVAVQQPTSQQANKPVQRGWFSDALSWVGDKVSKGVNWIKNDSVKWALYKAAELAGIEVDTLKTFFSHAGTVVSSIWEDPGAFLSNLIEGVKGGFNKFYENIKTHLKTGFYGWLFGTLADNDITIPSTFDTKSILTLIMEVLGLTTDKLQERVSEMINPNYRPKLPAVIQKLVTITSDGVGGIWTFLQDTMTTIKDMVMGKIQDWLVTKLIQKGVIKLISMFNPVTGLISIVQMIYKVITFIQEQAENLSDFASAVLGSLPEIAKGNISGAVKNIETAFAEAIPLAINLIAKLLGIDGLPDKVMEIVTEVQELVYKSVDKVLRKIIVTVLGPDALAEEEQGEKDKNDEDDKDGDKDDKSSSKRRTKR